MTRDEPELADAVPDEVWRAVAEAAEPTTLDETTADLVERCVRAALRTVRAGPEHTDN